MADVKVKHNREPLIHIVKRDDMVPWKAWLIRIATIIISVFYMTMRCLLNIFEVA